MDHDKTGCQAPPEGPILCVNNCGFFGSPATMNMCSKCHKDIVLKQEQAKLAASSFESVVNGSSNGHGNDSVVASSIHLQAKLVAPKTISVQSSGFELGKSSVVKPKEGLKRCTTCNKRVGLTGFNCRCGNLFCSVHRYSDNHECLYDYRTAASSAIAKANPIIKAEKLDKI